MIPLNRAVVGHDIEELRVRRGWTVADALYIFSVSAPKWSTIVRRGKALPVHPTLAIYVRLLDQYPHIAPIPVAPTAREMFVFLQQYINIDKKRFGIMVGNDASSGYRWVERGSAQPADVQKLFLIVKQMVEREQPENRAKVVEQWIDMVNREAAARGAPEPFKNGTWSPKSAEKIASEAAAQAVKAAKIAKREEAEAARQERRAALQAAREAKAAKATEKAKKNARPAKSSKSKPATKAVKAAAAKKPAAKKVVASKASKPTAKKARPTKK